MGRGVSLCRNAGMISCGGVRGETHAVIARHLKTLHPALLSDSFFFSPSSPLSLVFLFSLPLLVLFHFDYTFTSTSVPDTDTSSFSLDHSPKIISLFISRSLFFSSMLKFLGSASDHKLARCINLVSKMDLTVS